MGSKGGTKNPDHLSRVNCRIIAVTLHVVLGFRFRLLQHPNGLFFAESLSVSR